LHCQKSAKDVKYVVCCNYFLEFLGLLRFVGDESEQNKDGDDVDDERIATPGSNHVEVG